MKSKKWVKEILASTDGMKPFQVAEILEAERNLLNGMILPILCAKLVAAGAVICRLHSPTEWECTVQSQDPEVRKRVMAVINQTPNVQKHSIP